MEKGGFFKTILGILADPCMAAEHQVETREQMRLGDLSPYGLHQNPQVSRRLERTDEEKFIVSGMIQPAFFPGQFLQPLTDLVKNPFADTGFQGPLDHLKLGIQLNQQERNPDFRLAPPLFQEYRDILVHPIMGRQSGNRMDI